MSAVLTKGGNAPLAPADELGSLLVDIAWESGGIECDVVAIVCGYDRKVLDDEHFIFYNQTETPERSVFLLTAGQLEHSQLAVDITALPPQAERIVVSLSTVETGATLASVGGLRAAVHDPTTAKVLASYDVGEATDETCLIVCEIYRHSGAWKVRAVGQGYATGLRGLGLDYGVDL